MKQKALYIWWIAVLLISTLVFWLGYTGYITDIWNKDATYITSGISVLFLYGLAMLGQVAYSVKSENVDVKTNASKLLNRVWFLSEIEMGLAIVGTGIGIILLLGVNSNVNVEDKSALQTLLTHLWSTMGVAFYPNALGLGSSIILKILSFLLEEEHDENLQQRFYVNEE
jgi:hypothetical protein